MVAAVEAAREVDARNVISNAKRFIGQEFASVVEEIPRCSFGIEEGSEGGLRFTCPALTHSVTPEEVKRNHAI